MLCLENSHQPPLLVRWHKNTKNVETFNSFHHLLGAFLRKNSALVCHKAITGFSAESNLAAHTVKVRFLLVRALRTCCALTHFTAFSCTFHDLLQFSCQSQVLALCVFQCAGFMMTLKGLPSTYNKDLQVWQCVFVFTSWELFSWIFSL